MRVAVGWLDALIVLGFVAYALISGFLNRARASSSEEEFFLAGRSLSGWSAGVSMAATQFAVDTPLVFVGLVATSGVFGLWRFWVYGIAFYLLAFLLASRWWRARVVTDAEFSELRYTGNAAAALRAVKAVYFGLVFNCVVLAMVLLAATRFTEVFLHWDAWLPGVVFEPVLHLVSSMDITLTTLSSVAGDAGSGAMTAMSVASANNVISLALILGVTLLYSTTGGLRAVVKTDVAQFVLAMVSSAFLAWAILDRVGGFSGLKESLVNLYPVGGSIDHTHLTAFTPDLAYEAGISVLAMLGLQWFCQIDADGTGYLAQRAMACRSERDASLSGVVFTVAQVLLRSLVWLPIAVGLLVVFPVLPGDTAAVREATYVRGIQELLPAGVRGLALAGMFGALASTLDTHLNWGASYLSRDLIGRFFLTDISPRQRVWVGRVCAVVVLLVALMILPLLTSIQAAWKASLLLGAGVGPLLLLRWLWWRVTAWSELVALVVSGVSAVACLLWVEDDALQLIVCASTSTLAAVFVSWVTSAQIRKEGLLEFVERVHPPGLWRPFGRGRQGESFWRPVWLTVLSSVATFAALMGCGMWLVSTTPPWPFSSVFVAGLFFNLVSLVAVALLLRMLGFRLSTRYRPATDSA